MGESARVLKLLGNGWQPTRELIRHWTGLIEAVPLFNADDSNEEVNMGSSSSAKSDIPHSAGDIDLPAKLSAKMPLKSSTRGADGTHDVTAISRADRGASAMRELMNRFPLHVMSSELMSNSSPLRVDVGTGQWLTQTLQPSDREFSLSLSSVN